METTNSKLLQMFAQLIEVRVPDPKLVAGTPTPDLQAGLEQATNLFGTVFRPDPKSINPQAVGGQRFPNLQGVAMLFADGLVRCPDIAAELMGSPEDFTGAADIDQSFGRLSLVGQFLWRGGETGEAVAGSAAQAGCIEIVNLARARTKDLNQPAPARGDIAIAFEEPFSLLDSQRQRQLLVQQKNANTAQPYHTQIQGAIDAGSLVELVNEMMSAAQTKGGKIK